MEKKNNNWPKEIAASLLCAGMLGLFPYPIEAVSVFFADTIGSTESLNDIPEWVYAVVKDIKWGIVLPLISAYVPIRLFKPTSRKVFLSLPVFYLVFYEAALFTAYMMELEFSYIDRMIYLALSLICVVGLAYKLIGKASSGLAAHTIQNPPKEH